MALSDTKLRKIKAPYNGKTELSDRDGLSVRVSPKALITFNYRFRWEGKQQRIKPVCGVYPKIRPPIITCMYLHKQSLDLIHLD